MFVKDHSGYSADNGLEAGESQEEPVRRLLLQSKYVIQGWTELVARGMQTSGWL